jgi:hypothetical protein
MRGTLQASADDLKALLVVVVLAPLPFRLSLEGGGGLLPDALDTYRHFSIH